MTVESAVEAAVEFKVIGTRPIRHDGLDKVTGRAKFGGDVRMPGMLHGKILRSPHAHARIRSLDTGRAEALPGVKAVITAADLPVLQDEVLDFAALQGNARMLAENLLALEKVLYSGHAVAAVAATSAHIAEDALELIEVDYEALPAVLSVQDALRDDAPLLHEAMTTRIRAERFERGEDSGRRSNVAGHIQHQRGDPERGFRDADVIVEREFTTQTVHQGYIEPHASTAFWAADDQLTIWTSTQSTFGIRSMTSAMVGLPESRLTVIPMEIGGGFGGKLIPYLDPIAAVLSRRTGRPVKMVMSRKEVLESTGPTSGTHMRCKIGATQDGRITAAELYLAFEAGAFPGSPVGGGAMCGLGPYKIDDLLVDGYDVVCNKPKVQAYRAPGQPQAAYAVESVIDELAEELGIEAMAFRLMNVAEEGDRMANGVQFPRIGCREIEEAMVAHPHYTAPLEGPNRGRGAAMGYRFNAGGVSSATISVNADGTINLVTGAVDIGGTRTSVAMHAAEALGLRAEDVKPVVVDTDSVGWTGATAGSRVTFDTGLAAMAAAEEVKQQMAARAALLWDVELDEVEFHAGAFARTSDPDQRLSFKELAGKLLGSGGPITCSATNRNLGVGPIFGGNIVDVEVDPETGKVEILRVTAFMDAGRSVYPDYVEGQLQGGTVQAIGWALNEEYFYDDQGTLRNASLLDYRMPTTLDVPMIDTVIIEVPNPRHPLGLRGVGELPIIPTLAALGNAIHDATGVRLRALPMSPGAILEALENADGTA